MKPRLPQHIEQMLPPDVVHHIQTFLPHLPPKTPPNTPSPASLKALSQFQAGKHPAMQMYGLEDFLLDGK